MIVAYMEFEDFGCDFCARYSVSFAARKISSNVNRKYPQLNEFESPQ